MLAAMTHPSRVLNLDMKAKLCMPKSYITIYNIYIYIYIREKKYRLRKAQILYTLVVNISPVKASSVQSYGN